jgi:hypothetical protein
MPHQDDSRHSGYPLAALFVLLAVCATLLAMWGPATVTLFTGGPQVAYLITCTVFSTLLWGIVGGVVGLYHHRRGLGALLGAATGVTVGFLISPLAVTPAGGFPSLIVISLIGSLVLVIIGVVTRFTANRPQSPP